MTLSEAANRVIELSSKIRDYYDTELPRRFPTYPIVPSIEAEEAVPPPPEKAELKNFLESLPDELIYQLLLIKAVVWYQVLVEDLADGYEKLKDTAGNREQAISEIMWGDTIVGGELADGLERLREHKINLDRLPLKKAKLRKR